MTEKYKQQFVKEIGYDDPAEHAFVVVPDVAFKYEARSLYVGTQGDLTVVMLSGATVTFVDALGILPVRCTKVLAAGLSASDIVGLC